MKVNGSQVDVDDFKDLTSSERVKNIIDVAEYYGYSGDRVRGGLVFCSRTEEAETLSELFNGIGKKESGRKYRTVALTGKIAKLLAGRRWRCLRRIRSMMVRFWITFYRRYFQ